MGKYVVVATLTRVSKEDVSRALADYASLGDLTVLEGVPAGSVNSNYALSLSSGARLFLRIYEEQDDAGARAEAAMLVRLSERGVPCAPPLARADGRHVGTLAGKPAALFPWCEGGMRCQASVSPADAHAVGAALARVHRAGEGIVPGPHRFGYERLLERLERIAAAKDPELARQATVLRPALDAVHASRQSLRQGLVHGDLFRDNVLWRADEGSTIATLLDFESAFHGPLVYDLAVALLAWCFGDDLDDGLAEAMVRGYASVRPLEPVEREALHAEAMFGALRFTITRITDYAMREGAVGDRVVKDWRRFAMRYATLAQGAERFARIAGAD